MLLMDTLQGVFAAEQLLEQLRGFIQAMQKRCFDIRTEDRTIEIDHHLILKLRPYLSCCVYNKSSPFKNMLLLMMVVVMNLVAICGNSAIAIIFSGNIPIEREQSQGFTRGELLCSLILSYE